MDFEIPNELLRVLNVTGIPGIMLYLGIGIIKQLRELKQQLAEHILQTEKRLTALETIQVIAARAMSAKE